MSSLLLHYWLSTKIATETGAIILVGRNYIPVNYGVIEKFGGHLLVYFAAYN